MFISRFKEKCLHFIIIRIIAIINLFFVFSSSNIVLSLELNTKQHSRKTSTDKDYDGDGFSINDGDCDDYNADAYPGATEYCDNTDNDCNYIIDSGLVLYSYDVDNDGFGDNLISHSCMLSSDMVNTRGDCDDNNPEIHSGATDIFGDNIDSDCGGSDYPQISVGLSLDLNKANLTEELSLQDAIDKSVDGDIIWIGAGTYQINSLSTNGKNITLASTSFAYETKLSANNKNRAIIFNSNENLTTTIDGFSIINGNSILGSAILVNNSKATLKNLIITSNNAESRRTPFGLIGGYGGGIAVLKGEVKIENTLVSKNKSRFSILYKDKNNCSGYSSSGGEGAGIWLQESLMVAEKLSIVENISEGTVNNATSCYMTTKTYGGGIYASSSNIVIKRGNISKNSSRSVANIPSGYATGVASAFGAGITAINSNFDMEKIDIYENNAYSTGFFSSNDTIGGALFISESTLKGRNLNFSSNSAFSEGGNGSDSGGVSIADGGALVSEFSDIELYNTAFISNEAISYGNKSGFAQAGAANIVGNNFQCSNCLFEDNSSTATSHTNMKGAFAGALEIFNAKSRLEHTVWVGNNALNGYGGGALWLSGELPQVFISNSIMAYNYPNNISYNSSNYELLINYSDIYQALDATYDDIDISYENNYFSEPLFLSYPTSEKPYDFHLSHNSILKDAGDNNSSNDKDGTIADLGIYGGFYGSFWDMDNDGICNYYWAGSYLDAPPNEDSSIYDSNDNSYSIY